MKVEIVDIILGSGSIGNSIFSKCDLFPGLVFCFNNIQGGDPITYDFSLMQKSGVNLTQQTIQLADEQADHVFKASIEIMERA